MKTRITFIILLAVYSSIFAQSEHHITSGSNKIHVTTYGTGSPILIINGGPGMSSEGFRPLAKIIGQSNMAIIYDQRGTGLSKMQKVDNSTITLHEMVNDIEIIRKHLSIKRWIVFGHSFGGMLGAYYTSKFPDKVNGLILSSSGGLNMDLFQTLNITSRLSALEKDSLNYWSQKIARGDTSYFARLQRGKYLAPAYLFDKSNVPTVAHRLTQGNLRINSLVFQNMRAIHFDCTEELKKFEAPVLIIQGREDVIPKGIADTAHRVLQNSTLVILEDCGHYGWLDQGEEYFLSIDNFLTQFEAQNFN